MKISLIQTRQNALYDFANPQRTFTREEALRLQAEMLSSLYQLLQSPFSSDLIVTTEAVNFLGMPQQVEADYSQLLRETEGALLTQLSHAAASHHSYLVAGIYRRKNNGVVNTATVFDRHGKEIACYEKIHLAGSEHQYLLAGTQAVTVQTDFGLFGLCVCWDMQFPEMCRMYAVNGISLVVCPTWGWEKIYAHARAYENGIFVAGAMAVPYRNHIKGLRTPSEVVGPTGEVLVHASRKSSEVCHCEINLKDADDLRILRIKSRRAALYHL